MSAAHPGAGPPPPADERPADQPVAEQGTDEVPAPGPRGEDWRRFHPLSPLLRGGLFMVAVLGYLLSQVMDDILSAATGTSDRPGGPDQEHDGSGPDVEAWALDHPALLVVGLVLAILLVAALGVAAWWFTRYRLGASTIELRRGAIFRQHRQIRYDRIQAVSISRPILARLSGLAEVKVESAGGADSNVRLAFLTHSDALALQDRLLGLAADAEQRSRPPSTGTAGATGTPGGTPERPSGTPGLPPPTSRPPLVEMPFGRLLASTFLSPATLIVVVAVPLAALFAGLGVLGVVGGFFVPILFAAFNRIKHVLTWSNLTLVRQGDTLRVAHGLTDISTSTIPVERVQAIQLTQPWLWRWSGWWRLSVNVAGVKLGGDEITDAGVLVPVGTDAEVRATLDALTPGIEVEGLDGAMHGTLPAHRYASPPAARLLDPVTWRRNGAVVDPEVALLRRGWPGRIVQIVPHGRIQSMALHQGPVQRRLGLAQVQLVSTPGAVAPVTPHLRVADAERLYAQQGAAASAARGARGPDGGCESGAAGLHLSGMEVHRAEGRTS